MEWEREQDDEERGLLFEHDPCGSRKTRAESLFPKKRDVWLKNQKHENQKNANQNQNQNQNEGEEQFLKLKGF
jgi:hypothetical protein